MAGSKPIRRNLALVAFSKDHHFSLLLVWKIRQGLRLGIENIRIASYINFFFDENLEEHFKEEEKLLFTQLDKSDELRTRAEKEHDKLRKLNKKIALSADGPLIEKFTGLLEDHIRFEERSLFEHIQQYFTELQLQSIAEKMKDTGKKEEKWKDSFWIKNK
jgi:hemerythrin-like domain-containing protein